MKKLRKLVKPIISLLVILSMVLSLPTSVIAQTMITESIDSISMSDSTSDEADVVQGNIIGEDISKRDEFTKYFITDAGTTIAAQYAIPVHYKDDNDEYVDYDNSLTSTQIIVSDSTTDEATKDEVSSYSLRDTEGTSQAEEILVNKKSDTKVSHYKKSGRANLIEIERDGYVISWGYSGANVVTAQEKANKTSENLTGNDAYLVLPNLSSTVLYENIYNNVDLEVINSTAGVKENLILKAANTKNVFKIEYNIGDLTAESTDAHTIELKDSSGKVVYIISAPYMKDTAGEISKALELKILSNNKGKLAVKLTADKTWLKDKSRVYPVIVDPNIEYESTPAEVSCTYIESIDPNTPNGNEWYVYAGTLSNGEEHRSLIRINTLPELGNGNMIVYANVNLALLPENLQYTSYVGVYEITKEWEENDVTWNSFGTGGYDNSLIDYRKFVAGQSAEWIDWDITELVKKWYNGSANNGFMLKIVDGTSVNQNIRFASSFFGGETTNQDYIGTRPFFTMAYRNNKGLEDYWSYTAVDCGRAGTAYINDYSGNLVFDMPLVSTASPVLPASISGIYNSYLAGKEYTSATPSSGLGWKLNIQQTAFKTSGDLAVKYPYVYTDADSTAHYFYPKAEGDDIRYYDEDGLGLELIETGNTRKIITKDDDTLYFNNYGLLTKITNKANQSINIYYENTYKIKSIVDGEGNIINLDNVDENSCILTIKDCDDKTTTLTYSNEYLTKIEYHDDTTASFSYDNTGRLTSVTDVDGSKIVFTYSNQGSKGVTSVYEKGTNGTTGQTITFDRSKYNTTVIRTSGVNGSINNDDDIITTCQFDNFGMLTSTNSQTPDGEYLSASDAEYTDRTVNADASNIKQLNKVSQAYTIGANTENMLKNHSLEGTTNWTSAAWGSTGTVDYDVTAESTPSNVLYGQQSVKMTVNSVTQDKRGRIYQNVDETYIELGASYTLSCYVKVTDMAPIAENDVYGAVIGLTVFYDDGSSKNYYSEHITTVTDTDINEGFRRLSVTVPISATATDLDYIKANLAIHSATGTAYFDAVQLEKASTPGHYNLLENSSFERLSSSTQPTDWIGLQLTDSTSYDCISNANVDGNHSYRITGSTSKWKNLYQNVYLNDEAKEEDTYILSGWATGDSIPIGSNNAKFRLLARVYYTDGEYRDKADISFNDTLENVNWQYASGAFNLSDEDDSEVRTPDYIKVYLVYNYQGNRGYFDNLMLTKEAVPSYTYDTEGNLISVIANADQQSTYMYEDADAEITPEDNLLTKYTNPNNKSYDYKYYDNKQIKSVTAPSGLKATYTYDSKGNANSVVLSNGDLSLTESVTYTYSNGTLPNYSVKATNQRGMESTWRYNAKDGTLTGYTDPKGNSTTYTYNTSNDTLKKITNKDQAVEYTYDSNFKYLTKIKHGGTEYKFTYDQFGNTAKTEVGNRTLSTNTYYGTNGNLKMVTYGNGHYENYSYDNFGNLASVAKNNVIVAKNYANGRGDIIRSVDKINDLEYRAGFDSLGRLISKDVYSTNPNTNADTFRRSVEYKYDLMNNLTKRTFAYSNGTYSVTQYFYDSYNRPLSAILQNGKTFRNYYDGLNRVTKTKLNTTTPIETVYTYVKCGSNTTNIISAEESNSFAYKYAYDNNGNIVSIQNGEKQSDGTYRFFALSGNDYEYDRYNQLIKDTDYVTGDITTYTYDTNGNITQKVVANGRESTTNTYTYGDTSWGDLLTKYNGQTITYDTIGNPLTYRDGITMTWQNGRELATYEKGNVDVTYTYDPNGLRTRKQVLDGFVLTDYNYVYENGLLVQMTYGNHIYNFSYDANGTPVSLNHIIPNAGLNDYYYYGVNSRGDVEALYYGDGSLYVTYDYDAYGKPLAITSAYGPDLTNTDTVANNNPLRYRSYVYDFETGLYYLQSRYYDPTTCRFINADIYYETGQGINGYNMFAYCNNNPVMYSDPFGTWVITIFPVGGSASFIAGVSYNFGIAFDDKRNFEIIVNYANVLHDQNTSYWGAIGVGGTFSVQYYDVNDISDIYGYSDSMGGSGGPFWFAGNDITYGSPGIFESGVEGVQIVGGIGVSPIPFEWHAVSSKTVRAEDFFEEVFGTTQKKQSASQPSNVVTSNYPVNSYNHKLTLQEKRTGGIV